MSTSIHNEIVERFTLAKEGEIACNIQKSIVPAKLPAIPGLSLGTIFNPTVIRVAWVVASWYYGIGIVLYLALWIVAPCED